MINWTALQKHGSDARPAARCCWEHKQPKRIAGCRLPNVLWTPKSRRCHWIHVGTSGTHTHTRAHGSLNPSLMNNIWVSQQCHSCGELKWLTGFVFFNIQKCVFTLENTLKGFHLPVVSLFYFLHRKFARHLRTFTRFWKDALRLRWKSYLSFYSPLKEKSPAWTILTASSSHGR